MFHICQAFRDGLNFFNVLNVHAPTHLHCEQDVLQHGVSDTADGRGPAAFRLQLPPVVDKVGAISGTPPAFG
ncbi:hypothetical protein EVAR_45885_1 [Eumeta japonica]|uniref:Uncharacterized protein n=1 Tax=Eumeta variegata TaxID=151549 RepID=A0A4C1XUZ8_EUMVA|nr:hypothetical protein EVAR_45885_1 [Eumeta japonica]